jgi:hypothetical protein
LAGDRIPRRACLGHRCGFLDKFNMPYAEFSISPTTGQAGRFAFRRSVRDIAFLIASSSRSSSDFEGPGWSLESADRAAVMCSLADPRRSISAKSSKRSKGRSTNVRRAKGMIGRHPITARIFYGTTSRSAQPECWRRSLYPISVERQRGGRWSATCRAGWTIRFSSRSSRSRRRGSGRIRKRLISGIRKRGAVARRACLD